MTNQLPSARIVALTQQLTEALERVTTAETELADVRDTLPTILTMVDDLDTRLQALEP